jgi:hypothetical protein
MIKRIDLIMWLTILTILLAFIAHSEYTERKVRGKVFAGMAQFHNSNEHTENTLRQLQARTNKDWQEWYEKLD